MIAIAFMVGEPLYLYIWSVLFPQPVESVFLRLSAALLVIPLALQSVHQRLGKRNLEVYWIAFSCYALPISFFCLYALNGFNEVWMASCVAMIYVLFILTDWRIALAELALSVLVLLFLGAIGILGSPGQPSGAHLFIFAFAVATAVIFSASAANLQRERARSALITIGVLAHEFRTPLAAAGLLTEALESDMAELMPASLPVVRRLRNIFASMNSQVDYQLGNARLMDMPRARSVSDIGDLVATAVHSFPLSQRSMLDITTVKSEHGLLGMVHPDIFRQVALNLLSNSVKALNRKGSALAAGDVSVRVFRARPGVIRIEVADKGDGVPREMLDAIFEPFQTSSHMPSHGLGLAMCKNAITSFGGHIWCESVLGEGATFVIELPEERTAPAGQTVLAR